MNFIKNLALKLVISIFNTALTVFIVYWNFVTVVNALKTPNADWHQVLVYLVCSAVVLIIIWFMAILRFIRNLAILIIILLLAVWLYLPKLLPNINDSICVTIGSCKEGTEVKTVSGKILINEKTCNENGWKWDNTDKSCKTH